MDAKKIGLFIAGQRKSLGLTQAELAGKLHVTDKAVSRWERGQGLPDINLIEPLSDALGISIAEIMKGERSTAALSEKDASLAAKNIISMVEMKRAEHRKIAIVAAGLALLLFCVFLMDVMGPMGFISVVLPGFGLVTGIALACVAVIRKKRRLPIKATVLWSAILLAIPIIFFILLFMAGALGIGPVPD